MEQNSQYNSDLIFCCGIKNVGISNFCGKNTGLILFGLLKGLEFFFVIFRETKT